MTRATAASVAEPYIGPRPFERTVQDQARFFGRDMEAAEIVSLVLAHPMVVLYAASGAGKTSLLNAKVAPLLERHGCTVLPPVRLRTTLPDEVDPGEIGNFYCYTTVLQLCSNERKRPHPAHLVARSLPDQLAVLREQQVAGRVSASAPTVLVFDQFEELFTSEEVYRLFPDSWHEHREGFFAALAMTLEHDPLLRVVLSLREDFLAQLDPHTALLPSDLWVQWRLQRLDRDAAVAAVSGPLPDGYRFLDDAAEELVSQLLVERRQMGLETIEVQGQFVEPLYLQLVCRRLWDRLFSKVPEVSVSHLEDVDIEQVLADFYGDAVAEAAQAANVDERVIRRFVDGVLITAAGTRGTAFRGELRTATVPNRAIDVLEQRRVIRAEERAGARWYELTHDLLIEPARASNRDARLRATFGSAVDEEERAWQLARAAEIAVGEGDTHEAIRLYGEALELAERLDRAWDQFDLLERMAQLNLDEGNHAEALRLARRVQKLLETSSIGWSGGFAAYVAGRALHESGDEDEAAAEYRKSLDEYRATEPDNHLAVAEIESRISELRDTATADNLFSELLDAARDRPEIQEQLADWYSVVARFDRSIKLMDELLAAYPDNVDYLNRRAGDHWYAGEFDAAIADYTRMLDLGGDEIAARNGRGHAYAESGRYEEAEADLLLAIEMADAEWVDDVSAYARNGLALARSGLGERREALDMWAESLKRAPDNAWAFFHRAGAHEAAGDVESARRDYRTALAADNPALAPRLVVRAEERLRALES